MAESMVSVVVALVLVVTGITIFSAHHRREHHGQRLWDRMRHRH